MVVGVTHKINNIAPTRVVFWQIYLKSTTRILDNYLNLREVIVSHVIKQIVHRNTIWNGQKSDSKCLINPLAVFRLLRNCVFNSKLWLENTYVMHWIQAAALNLHGYEVLGYLLKTTCSANDVHVSGDQFTKQLLIYLFRNRSNSGCLLISNGTLIFRWSGYALLILHYCVT